MNVTVIKQLIHNDISSTKIRQVIKLLNFCRDAWLIIIINRLFVKRGMSIKYLLPNPVIDYIHKHGLYLPSPPPSNETPIDSTWFFYLFIYYLDNVSNELATDIQEWINALLQFIPTASLLLLLILLLQYLEYILSQSIDEFLIW